MTIESGTRLGPYEVIAPIGAGGMGEVYKAKDTRLDRTVAIKVLPEHLAESPERKARFEREAKAISQLNHPHICTLHDVGSEDGTDYLVMEYIEGETLAERLKKGALKLDQALEYGIQIANGLDTAHRAGVVHRDLKPANAMLTRSGVKLLDFGLAKLVESETNLDESDAPTQQQGLTQEKAIIGTLQYMAPEQLENRTADARTDIFALGAVLYEMLTGRKAFEGANQASLIGAILQTEPPSMATHGLDSPSLEHIVRTCLIKDPDERWQSAFDIARNLRWIRDEAPAAQPATPVSSSSRNRERAGWAIALLVAAVVTSMTVWSFMKPGPQPVKRLSFTPPAGMFFSSGAAFSNDAGMLAFSACDGACDITEMQAYVRGQDQLDAVAVPGTESAFQVFFSPDGEWLGFTDDEGLKKAALAGGPEVSLYRGFVSGASWATNDFVVFGTEDSGLMRIPASGDGEAEPLTTASDGEAHRWPYVLPGDRAVLFTVWRDSLETSEVAVVSLDTGEQQSLVSGVFGVYSPSGYLVFAREGALWAMQFDAERLTVTGPPVLVVDGVETASKFDSLFALDAEGSLIYEPARTMATGRRLLWVDREGQVEPIPGEPDEYYVLDMSPDGRKAAIDVTRDNRDIWIYDLIRNTSTRLTSDLGSDSYPVWTHDGARVIYGSSRGGGPRNLYWADSLGAVDVERLTTSPKDQLPHDVTADGAFLIFIEYDDAGSDIGALSLEGERQTELILNTRFDETHPAISPDGRWLAYESDESGQHEVFVRPFPNVNDGRWQISSSGGNWPVWAPNGRELFYWSQEGLVAVAVNTDPVFRPGDAQLLFEDVGLSRSFGRTYDVSPDGKRFLLVEQNSTVPAAPHLAVVLNWTEELKRLVPTSN